MKKHAAILFGILASMALVTACGGKSAPADETQAQATTTSIVKETDVQGTARETDVRETTKEIGVKGITKKTYSLVQYEAGGMVMKGDQLAATGMANGTYVEMISNGSGKVSIMGTANPMTWDDSGVIKINNYPVYTFSRVDAETIILEQSGVKFTMSAAAQAAADSKPANTLAASGQDYVDTYELAKNAAASGAANKDATTYYLYAYEAHDHVYDDFTDGEGESLKFSDFIGTTLTLNQDGTALFSAGGVNSDTFKWSKDKGVIGSHTYTMEWLDEDKIALTQYGVLKYLLTSQERPDETLVQKKEGLKKASHSNNGQYGSCGYLNAPRTLMVSIYLSDDRAKWEDNERDQKAVADTLYMMKAGAAWLSNNVAEYGYDSEFLADWEAYPDLKYSVTYNGSFDDDESLEKIRANHYYIGNTEKPEILRSLLKGLVDGEALKRKYNADNIAYYFLYNNWDNEAIDHFGGLRSWAGMGSGDEVAMIYTKWKRPNVIPHETLHLFDAPDLYQDEFAWNSGIPSAYTTYLIKEKVPEIMGAETKELYFGFNGEIGPVTAYYVNLTDEKPEFEGQQFKERSKE